MTTTKTSAEPREFEPGPEILLREIRHRVHPSIPDQVIKAVLVPALTELAQMARLNHQDRALLKANPPAPESHALREGWDAVADWLFQIRGQQTQLPQRETTQEEYDIDSALFLGE